MKLNLFAVVFLAAFVLAACSEKTELPPAAKQPTAVQPAAQTAAAVKAPLELNLQLPTFGTDKIWNSQDYKGKPVLVAVMATWCPWCKRSLGALDQTTKAYADKVEVIGIFEGDDMSEISKVMTEYNIQSKILYNGRPALEQLGVKGFPYILLFDKDHKLVQHWAGYSDNLADMYAAEIDILLK